MDPVTISALSKGGSGTVQGLGSLMVGGSMAFRTYQDYVHPERNISYIVEGKRETFQERMQMESQIFQRERDADNYQHQIDLECKRMEFQEHMEYKRMQFQLRLQERQEELQKGLAEMNNRNNRMIAEYQALAMRETQVLISRMNAMNLLQNNMILDALKSFPLNISPIVLLQNRPHSLKSLLRLSEKDDNKKLTKYELEELRNEIETYEKNPEPLSIFIAPLQMDSRFQYHRELSTKVWELTFHTLEGIITRNYNPSSERPVMFYPTAWNEKVTSGMHASETLHFFLKDMPCVVLEPRFDGKNFHIAFSAWNIGYTSSEHEREEYTIPLDIDLIVAETIYNRSKKAIKVMDYLDQCSLPDEDLRPLRAKYRLLSNNIKIYEALKIKEHVENGTLDELEAFGLLNMFKMDLSQDLIPIASILAAHIGINISMMADTHHLLGTKAAPIFHKCVLNEELFNPILTNKDACEKIATEYENLLYGLRDAEKQTMPKLAALRDVQAREISLTLNVHDSKEETLEERIRTYARKNMTLNDENINLDFDDFFTECVQAITAVDKQWFMAILEEMEKDNKYKKHYKKLDKRLEQL